MRLPKGWNKFKLMEQEDWLINKLEDVYKLEDEIKRNLAIVRGGQRVHLKEDISRPDEAMMKHV